MLISERYSYGVSKIKREVLKHINVKLMHVKKVHNNFYINFLKSFPQLCKFSVTIIIPLPPH